MTVYYFTLRINHFFRFGGSYFVCILTTDYFEKFSHKKKEAIGKILVHENLFHRVNFSVLLGREGIVGEVREIVLERQ